eukprot:TRINITY_DN17083_c0_g1_i2.p1 TRINITY_DN17083_c0_g1~~TRINITY_DN17083_c0_g1_i2.p1  ORF type:complete len:392 (-),score=34.60 TRINITY_DN17083_c0_g1_i2:60-1235(-)
MATLSWKYKLLAALLVLVLTVLGTVAVVEWVHSGMSLTHPAVEGHTQFERWQFYVSVIVVFCVSLAYDMCVYGLTMTLRHGAVAAVVSWILVVPLGILSQYAMVAISFVTIVGASFALCVCFNACMRMPTWLRIIVLVVQSFLAFWFCCHFLGFLTRTVGAAIFFLGVQLLVRFILNFFGDPVISWPGVVAVNKKTDEFKKLASEFAACNVSQQDKYPMDLEIQSAYRLDQRSQETSKLTRKNLVRTDRGRRLYHGTPRHSAQAIVSDGFRLPAKAGMFGKGIYFADCPLKSWQYTDGISGLRSGVMLCCWVELGRTSPQGGAWPSLRAPPARSFWDWITGESEFQSVTGLTQEEGGSLRVPEYIIYDPAHVEVDYIFEVGSIPNAVLDDT